MSEYNPNKRKYPGKPSYGEFIKEAKKTETQLIKEAKEENDPDVNVCIKVPLSYRRHWQSKAKESGITVTEILIDALIKKFGVPNK